MGEDFDGRPDDPMMHTYSGSEPTKDNQIAQENTKTSGALSREFVISPEIEEVVMAKVKDILSGDEPYTRVLSGRENIGERLKSLLDLGILGQNQNNDKHQEERELIDQVGYAKAWAKLTKEHRKSKVYFNKITGNTRSDIRMSENGIALTFDLKGFEETTDEYIEENPQIGRFYKPYMIPIDFWRKYSMAAPGKTGTYRADDPSYLRRRMPGSAPGNLGHADPEFGWILYHRVAPRELDGIILNSEADTSDIIQQIVEAFSEQPKSGPLPIYDMKGNLLWPKQMTHSEVTGYIKERNNNGRES